MRLTRVAAFALIAVILTLGQALSQSTNMHDTIPSIAFVDTDVNADALYSRYKSLRAADDWAGCLKAIQELKDRFSKKVLRTSPSRFAGIHDFCMNELLSIPPAGVKAYRELFDYNANDALKTAVFRKDHKAMAEISEKWPLASIAVSSALAASDLASTSGDLDSAALTLRRALEIDASTGRANTADIIVRLGQVIKGLNDGKTLDWLSQTVSSRYPELKINANGVQTDAVAYIAGLTGDVASHNLPPDESIGMSGISDPRIWDATAEDFERLLKDGFSFNLPQKTDDRAPFRPSGDFIYGGDPRFTPYYPAISGGKLFAHNGSSLFAIDLFDKSAKIVWQHHETVDRILFEDKAVYSTVVYDERLVIANLVTSAWPEEIRLGYLFVKMPFPCRALAAFDAVTGKIKWEVGGDIRADDFLHHASFSSPPVISGSKLYAPVVYFAHANDPPEQYLVCLDAETGNMEWKTFVSSGFIEINLFNGPGREQIASTPVIYGDIVIFTTNSGAIAGIDRNSGNTVWKRTYNQFRILTTQDSYINRGPTGWLNSMPLVHKGTVFVTPADSPNLYAINPANGDLKWAWSPISRELPRHMVGALNDLLYISFDNQVIALDASEKGQGRMKAMTGVLKQQIIGKGVLSSNYAYIPTYTGIMKLSLPGLKQESVIGFEKPDRNTGNIFALSKDLVITTSTYFVNVFIDRSLLEGILEQRIARSPNDVKSIVALGQMKLGQGKIDEAERYLRLAAFAGRGRDASAVQNATMLLCDLAIGKAALLAQQNPKEAIDLLIAERNAYMTQPNATIKLTFALSDYMRQNGAAVSAVDELQNIILTSPDIQYSGEQARSVAKREIAAILKQFGRKTYDRHETEAKSALSASDGSFKSLKLVINNYPNSTAAEEASLAMIDKMLAKKSSEDAMAVITAFSTEFPESEHIPGILLKQCQYYDGKGYALIATKIAIDIRNRFPQFKPEEVARIVGKNEALSAGILKLPDVSIPYPITSRWSQVMADMSRILTENRNFANASWSNILPFTDEESLSFLDTTTSQVFWSEKLQFDRYFFLGNMLVLSTNDGILVKKDDGKTVWKKQVRDGMGGMAVSEYAVYAQYTDPGNGDVSLLTSYEALNGQELWTVPFGLNDYCEIEYASDKIVVVKQEPPKMTIYNALTGAVELSIAMPNYIGKYFITDDGYACVATIDLTYCFYRLKDGARTAELNLPGADLSICAGKNSRFALYSDESGDLKFNSIIIVDAETGKSQNIPLEMNARAKTIFMDDDQVYALVGSSNITRMSSRLTDVIAYSARNGSVTWRFKHPYPFESARIEKCGEVFTLMNANPNSTTPGSKYPVVDLVDAKTGNLLQRMSPGMTMGNNDYIFDFFGPKLYIYGNSVLHCYGNRNK